MSDSSPQPFACVVASDSPADAALVESLLKEDFEEVIVCAPASEQGARIPRDRPIILVLVFREMQAGEQFYLGLYQHGAVGGLQPHRAVLLCAKEHVPQAYSLCRNGLFCDYVVFWPVTHDQKRLLMSVHRSMDELRSIVEGHAAGAFATQARRISELESLLEQSIQRGQQHIASADQEATRIVRSIEAGLTALTDRLLLPGAPEIEAHRARMTAEINRSNRELLPQLRAFGESLRPLSEWIGALLPSVAPQLESARALGAMAARVPRTILVVDDDEFQRNLAGSVLKSEGYVISYAAGGSEALNALGRSTPDLILLDFQMPDLDGIEVMRRLKTEPRLAAIPVIMLTGHADREVVVDSSRQGVADFVVKPFRRGALLDKVARLLRP